MDISELKHAIEDALNTGELERAGDLIEEYAEKIELDFDLLTYRTILNLYMGDTDKALYYGEKAVRQYPTSAEAYFNLGSVYERKGDLVKAIINYQRSDSVLAVAGITEDIYGTEPRLVALWEKLADKFEETKDPRLLELIKNLMEWRNTEFGTQDTNYRPLEKKKIVGTYLWMDIEEKMYVASYRVQSPELLDDKDFNAFQMKLEIRRVNEGKMLTVGDEADEYLIPIAVKNDNTTHFFTENEVCMEVPQKQKETFNYYRVKKGTMLKSSDTAFYGKLVPLIHKSDRKKLVLNIFVDGLSQYILNNVKDLMPHTYRFFEKGTIFTRAYSASEWTYPSTGTYNSGLYTPGHMMFHNILSIPLPAEITTLAEYFHNVGYHTTKMDGDWRSTPNYGYYRGYDQFIYQNQHLGSKDETILGEVIDHIEAFKDTDQFLWFEMGDLHDVADTFDLTPAVQAHLPLSNRTLDTACSTSVKQDYSEKKILAYEQMIKNVDNLLSLLYYYLESRYRDDEYIVSLFADHGQGYIVPDGDFFLSKGRSQIAFMFKGGKHNGMTEEIVSNCDYIPIMCVLAGIPLKTEESIDGRLPEVFGGEKGREYVISECIYPGDRYQAAIHTKDKVIYFVNNSPTGQDGRFELTEPVVTVQTLDGKAVKDKVLEDKYSDIILKHIAPLIISG